MCEPNREKSVYFNLGAFNYPCFYDAGFWIQDGRDFEYKDYFRWGFYGEQTSEGHKISTGDLDESKFNTLQSKFEYIKGRLSAYCVTVGDKFIRISHANSYLMRDRLVKWIKEIIDYKFCRINIYKIKQEDWYVCCPGIAEMELEAEEEIIKYFLYEEEIGNPMSNEECTIKLNEAVKLMKSSQDKEDNVQKP